MVKSVLIVDDNPCVRNALYELLAREEESRESQSSNAKWIRSQMPRLLPIAQASPTGHTRTAAQPLRQHLPRNAAAKNKQNAPEASSIR